MNLPAPPPNEPWTLRARWVFPADAAPIPDGRITIRDGGIESVQATGIADLNLGNVAILPGLVNAHTHLDLGGLRGRCPPTPDLPAWLRCVIEGRRAMSVNEKDDSIRDGIAECLRFGTTLVGDISAGALSCPWLAESSLWSTEFYELIGLPRDRAEHSWQAALGWLNVQGPSDLHWRTALSLHAPYSVHRDLFIRTARWASDKGFAVAIHLAESEAELQLLREHAGPFVDFLRALGVWAPEGLVASPAAVMELVREAPHVLLVHGNYLPPDTPFYPNHTLVYCPRTHAAFGHPRHPFPSFLERGVRVALGTDSLASNPDLDMLAEARFVHARYPEVDGDVLLRMLTLNGAEALGWADRTGSLTPGKSADFVVLPLPDAEPADPHDLLWESALPVQHVVIRGVPVYPT